MTSDSAREIDALVAEHVMGEPCPPPICDDDREPPTSNEVEALHAFFAGNPKTSPEGSWVALCFYEQGDIPTWTPRPFSTDIAAAWEVVEKMPGALGVMKSSDGRWKATFDAGDEDWVHAYADTAPLAICLAALAAKGVEP